MSCEVLAIFEKVYGCKHVEVAKETSTLAFSFQRSVGWHVRRLFFFAVLAAFSMRKRSIVMR